MAKPLYEHDCDTCVFLGTYEHCDLYVCRTDTVIARASSDGGNYCSGMCFVGINPLLTEAARRAVERGILDPSASTTHGDGKTIGEAISHA